MADDVSTPDICVIGAGSGGLSVAAAASAFGVPTVLIERGTMGGDCLNSGCVPSKSLIAVARQAHAMRHADRFTLSPVAPEIDFQQVHDHVHAVIAEIAPTDSPERYRAMGVDVIEAEARFTGPDTVVAGGRTIRARRFVIATGSVPFVPPIEGLDGVPHLTSDTIFDLVEKPGHLVVLGGGPIGVELAQAHARLGVEVTVVEAQSFLAKEDPELAAAVLEQAEADGVRLLPGARATRVAPDGDGFGLFVEIEGREETIRGSHLLVAVGRRAVFDGLGLEAGGIERDAKGLKLDARLRTTNRKVHVVGDAAGGPQFTHVANYHAGIAIRNILFRLPAKASHEHIPRVTYTDPELAQVGLTEAEARERHGQIRVLRFPYAENDRARTDRAKAGHVKAITDRRGRILGAGIVGANADELIAPWTLAVTKKLPIRALTEVVAPYPTLGEISKRAAYDFYRPGLTNPWTRRIIALLRRLG